MTIAEVRVLTSDLPQYERAVATGDGSTLEFQVGQYPVITNTELVYLDGVAQTPVTDYELDTEVGLVTFVTAPASNATIVVTYRHALLSNDQIQMLIDLQGDTKLAAALALDTIASNEALVQKKTRLLDLTTDGPAVAKALRDHAKALREEVATGDAVGAFDIAEQVTNVFGARERWRDQWMRRAI